MRKILVVAVIASVACREPAPQNPVSTGTAPVSTAPVSTAPVSTAPVSTGTAQCRTPPSPPPPPPSGMPQAQWTAQLERTYGPVIASGTEAGRPWSLRGRIDARGAATWLQTGTGGGGGRGALPFQDLGWKKLGHFGTVGSGEHHGIGAPGTLTLTGVVSKQTAAIDVRLADGTGLPAQIIDTGDARANFFVAVWSAPFHWEVMIARDAAGAELETYRQPPPPATPIQATASQASATRVTATRASATSTP